MQITPANLSDVTDARLADGMSPDATVGWLQQNGVPAPQAQEAVQKAHARRTVTGMRSNALRRANGRLWFGVALFTVALGITVYTYASAEVGETYTVMWGALVVGILAMARGVWARVRVGRAAAKVMADLS